ncbi:uncharacterized protein LOC131956430 [Physella acuta]|uniref:uncharacterized protein LOC131956430 n=1 Tax=Physella acuta TaxID=109671 RepID=UPI0027DD9D67|nr:uncharacterized protein LOC131956430 [Physella acuta]
MATVWFACTKSSKPKDSETIETSNDIQMPSFPTDGDGYLMSRERVNLLQANTSSDMSPQPATRGLQQEAPHVTATVSLTTYRRSENPYDVIVEAQACDVGWFGQDCKLQCHCTNNKCADNGTCINGSRCKGEWFGPACQYQDLAIIYTAKSPFVRQLCNASEANQRNEVSWKIPYPFTFMWVKFNPDTKQLTSNININITDGNSTCDMIYQSAISQDTVEFRCRTTVNMTRLVLSGENVKNICNVYISGGRNVAVKQSASQDSTYTDYGGSSNASNAVDGNRNRDLFKGSCMHTKKQTGDQPHYWTVNFSGEEYRINRYVLYSRWDTYPSTTCCPKRISGFTLTSWNNKGDQVFTYTAPEALALVHTVVSGSRDVAGVNVTLDVDYLNFCEAEVYGVA